jgi:hypothetical protein
MAKKKTKQTEPAVEFVICDECGNEQADMGRNVSCEECGEGPMPSAAYSKSHPQDTRGEVK